MPFRFLEWYNILTSNGNVALRLLSLLVSSEVFSAYMLLICSEEMYWLQKVMLKKIQRRSRERQCKAWFCCGSKGRPKHFHFVTTRPFSCIYSDPSSIVHKMDTEYFTKLNNWVKQIIEIRDHCMIYLLLIRSSTGPSIKCPEFPAW